MDYGRIVSPQLHVRSTLLLLSGESSIEGWDGGRRRGLQYQCRRFSDRTFSLFISVSPSAKGLVALSRKLGVSFMDSRGYGKFEAKAHWLKESH